MFGTGRPLDLSGRRETSDGRQPDARHLDPAIAAAFPIPAFSILRSADLFDAPRPRSLDGQAAAERAVDASVKWGTGAERAAEVRPHLVRQLSGNPALAGRLERAKPVRIDVVESRRHMVSLGYPPSVARHAAGLFWDHPDWSQARVALRRDQFDRSGGDTLVVHEYAHAIHYLAFTADERELVARVLRPVFAHPADQDEVFAIYSEREFVDERTFSALERQAPGVYGLCRRQWSEDHVFAAFVKKLYRPASGVRAGDRERRAALSWKAFSGG